MENAKFTPGQPVRINLTLEQSAFAGWTGTVQEIRPADIGRSIVVVSFDAGHAVYDSTFFEHELIEIF